jgi:hypothetical protein
MARKAKPYDAVKAKRNRDLTLAIMSPEDLAEHQEKTRARNNAWDAKNREKRNAAKRIHGQKEATKALRRINQKALRVRQIDKFKAKDRAYLERLKEDPVRLETKRTTRRTWEQNKRETDIEYVLRGRLRSRVRMALKKQAGEKAAKTMELVGTTMDGLRKHLESTFKPGMSWDELGKGLHIDHIIPLAQYDLTDPEQQKVAFHYSNLQVLTAQENWSKGARLDWTPEDGSSEDDEELMDEEDD